MYANIIIVNILNCIQMHIENYQPEKKLLLHVSCIFFFRVLMFSAQWIQFNVIFIIPKAHKSSAAKI